MAHLIEALVAAGKADEAVHHLERVADPNRRSQLKGLVEAKSTDSIEALRAQLEKSPMREEKLALLQKLFEKLLAAGKLDEAEATIEKMVAEIQRSPRPEVRSKFGNTNDAIATQGYKGFYARVAEAYAAAGDEKSARRCTAIAQDAIAQMPEEAGINKGFLVGQLTNTLLKLGDVGQARKLVESLPANFGRSLMAAKLADAYLAANDPTSTVAMAKLVSNGVGKGHQIGRIAAELIRAKHLNEARQVLKYLGDGQDDAEAYRDVGKAMTEEKQTVELNEWLGKMPSDMARAYACLGAVDGFSKP